MKPFLNTLTSVCSIPERIALKSRFFVLNPKHTARLVRYDSQTNDSVHFSESNIYKIARSTY